MWRMIVMMRMRMIGCWEDKDSDDDDDDDDHHQHDPDEEEEKDGEEKDCGSFRACEVT